MIVASFVSSILYSSVSKIETISKNYRPNHETNAECIPSPPPYDPMQQNHPMSLSSHPWALSEVADKTKSNVDRHCISQGMKLVYIAADEYEGGNESIALNIYLTGVDKILMALPNKSDINTKLAIKEKLTQVEERVGVQHNENNKKSQQQENRSTVAQTFLLSRLTSTISSMSTKAVKSVNEMDQKAPSIDTTNYTDEDPMTRFKQFGKYMIEAIVTCAILIKQSPIPDLVSFMFGYLFQIFLWLSAQYHIKEKVQDFGIYCIKYGIEANEKYHLHEYITEGIYMIVVAILKAAVAFKETPRYKESLNIRETKTNVPIEHNKSLVENLVIEQPQIPQRCIATSPPEQKQKLLSMIWTPW